MKKVWLVLVMIMFAVPLFVSCEKEDDENQEDKLEWSPIKESKFLKENYSFQFEEKTITGNLYVEVEDLAGKIATVEVTILDVKVKGTSIGGDFTWAEIIDNGKFVGIDSDWTGAYDDNMNELDDEWSDLMDRLVLKYIGSKHTVSTNGIKFSFQGDPILGTVEVPLRK
jgi:hypothetical protein